MSDVEGPLDQSSVERYPKTTLILYFSCTLHKPYTAYFGHASSVNKHQGCKKTPPSLINCDSPTKERTTSTEKKPRGVPFKIIPLHSMTV